MTWNGATTWRKTGAPNGRVLETTRSGAETIKSGAEITKSGVEITRNVAGTIRSGAGGQGHRGGHQGRRDIPPFCRDGSGHPAHGWAWCVEKGYASAEAPRQAPRPHLRRDQGLSISFRVAYERIFAQGDGLTSADLEVILSRQAMDRFRTQRDRLGAEAPLEGRWVPGRGEASGGVLQLRAGDVPVAELADWNGDGHVDDAFLAERPAR